MTNEEILKAAIEKAFPDKEIGCDRISCTYCGCKWYIKIEDENFYSPEEVVFSKDFAKAFWGEDPDPGFMSYEPWETHLITMVIKEDPIKYLEQFLD